MGEAMSRRIRGVFNAANFWAIVLYNILSLNSLEFAKLVGRRLIFKGKSHLSAFFRPTMGEIHHFENSHSLCNSHRLPQETPLSILLHLTGH